MVSPHKTYETKTRRTYKAMQKKGKGNQERQDEEKLEDGQPKCN